MKDKVQIKFVDFWPGFDPSNNFFVDLLGSSIELSDEPELIIFSNFGQEHLKYACFKVFFSAENERPNFFETDIALTFDYIRSKRHFRLPLFLIYIKKYNLLIDDEGLGIEPVNHEEWLKRDFCCMVVSNGNAKMRNSFYNFLCKKEKIASGGRYLNNVGGAVDDKLEFIKNYKFVISFENSKFDGYTTEKILEPFVVNSIPVYWGNRLISFDFNLSSFLYVRGKRDFERVYLKMKQLEKNIEAASLMIDSKKIVLNQEYYDLEKLRLFILESYSSTRTNVSQKFIYRIITHFFWLFKTLKYWLKHYTVGNFR